MDSSNPIPAISRSSQFCDRPAANSQRNRRTRQTNPFLPSALLLLFLGIAVGLWGYGYKLSLYQCHCGTAQANQVVKLWDQQSSSISTLHVCTHRGRNLESPAKPVSEHSVAPEFARTSVRPAARSRAQLPVEFELLSRPPPSITSL